MAGIYKITGMLTTNQNYADFFQCVTEPKLCLGYAVPRLRLLSRTWEQHKSGNTFNSQRERKFYVSQRTTKGAFTQEVLDGLFQF